MTAQPQTDFATERTIALPVNSCLGDFFFIFGVTFQVLEALNFGRGEITTLTQGLWVETMHITDIPKGSEEPKKKPQDDLEAGISKPAATAKAAVIGSLGFILYLSLQ